MKTMTLRNVPADLARELEREKVRRGESLNQVAIDLMKEALGLNAGGKRSNGLGELAGSWSAEELAEFERVTAQFEQVDAELWA